MIATSWRDTVSVVSRNRLIGILVAAHVVLKIVLLRTALATPVQGDELTYNDGANVLAAAVRAVLSGGSVPTAEISDHLIGNGWFMPGMSLLLFPLYLVDPGVSDSTIRLYLGTLTLVGFLAAVAAAGAVMGRRYAVALLVLPGLVPMWVLYSYTAWGDLSGGLAVVLVIALLVALWRRLDSGAGVRLRDGLLLGLLLAVTLYLRSSALPLVAGLLVLAALAVGVRSRGVQRRRSIVAWVAACAVFVALLLPWSYAASRALGGRVVTTTTVPISMAYTFGHRDELCFGPCRAGNVWFEMARYADEVERETGVNKLTVQEQLSAYARRDVTVTSYVRQVRDDFGRYVFSPTGFEAAFRPTPQDPQTTVSRISMAVTRVLYFAGLALAAVSVVWVRRRARVHQVIALLTSLVGAALMTQPFVHVSTPRYWPVFVPLFGLAVATLSVRPRPEASSRWLWRLQLLSAAGWVAVVAALLLVGR